MRLEANFDPACRFDSAAVIGNRARKNKIVYIHVIGDSWHWSI